MNTDLQTFLDELDAKDLQEVIDYCKNKLQNTDSIKDYVFTMMNKYNKKANIKNCRYVMLGGVYKDDNYIGNMCFHEEFEYENMLNKIYEDNFKSKYTWSEFVSIDFTMQLYEFIGDEDIKKIYDKLKKCNGYPCKKEELMNSDNGFGVVWCYDIKNNEIITFDIDLY
jgi:hypothetical protein